MMFHNKKISWQSIYYSSRPLVFMVVIFILALIIITRLFVIQIIQHPFYEILASEKHEVYKDLFPARGQIYTRENNKLYPLVANRDYYLVYAEPTKIKNPNKIIDAVTPILGLEEKEWKDLLGRLGKTSDPYEPIKHKVTKKQVEEIEKLKLAGVGYSIETYRFYPEKNIGGQLFGFLGIKGDKKVGQYGLEGYFNIELSGQPGLLISAKDAVGSLITIGTRSVKKAEDGINLVLSIDRQIQFTACEKLKAYYQRFEAQSATVIIMQPKTGAILAMCNFPDFDPDNYNKVEDVNYFNNPAIFYAYEPGSVFKAITMASALDKNVVTPSTVYNDEGEIKVGPFTIKNSDLKAHGEQSMTAVLEKSLNTGAIFAEQKVGKNSFRDYVKSFGFGQKTGIELDTEVTGDISSLDKKGEIYGMTASYGQGISVTSLQMINAFAAIANQGRLLKPYVVSEMIKPNGDSVKTQVKEIRQVITPKTATLLTGMLVSVIENGYSKKAQVPGYYLAGKSGTAQVASDDGGYGSKTIHNFIGFGPASNPAFVILVKLDKPSIGPLFSSDTIAPLFSQLAEYLLKYYQIPPDY